MRLPIDWGVFSIEAAQAVLPLEVWLIKYARIFFLDYLNYLDFFDIGLAIDENVELSQHTPLITA